MSDPGLAIERARDRQVPIGSGPATASAHGTATRQGRSRRKVLAFPRAGLRIASVILAIWVFVLGLRMIAAGAGGVQSFLSAIDASGPTALIGFGWVSACAMLSGSPVAGLAISLLDGGALSRPEALGMLAGSRFGASFVVVVVGALAYFRGRRAPDGIYVGVVALITSATMYGPGTLLALWLVDRGTTRPAADLVPSGWGSLINDLVQPAVRAIDGLLPGPIVLILGVALMLGAFSLFDRALPRLDPPSAGIERWAARLDSVPASFLLGAGVTSLTMSVALSITILVPLSLKGIVRKRQLVPYIMGANITTLLDTLFGASVLRDTIAIEMVLSMAVAITAVAGLLLAVYPLYSKAVFGFADRIMESKFRLVGFVGTWATIPVALLILS